VAGTVVFDQQTKVAQPKLWHPDHPVLYRAVSTITGADRYETTFGFRWFEWTADRGFFLNGEHFYLLGANVHQDHAGWGDAVTAAGMARDVKLIKEAGFNFIRGSHYPHAPAFADACDRLGMLFWSENAFWGIGGFEGEGYWTCSAYPPRAEDQPEFEASVKQQLWEMIRIHRNHPSIVAWSMCNEPFFTEESQLPKMKMFLKELVALTHKLDPTRPAAMGGVQRPLDEKRLDHVSDVAGYNGDGATHPALQNPGVPSIVAEYGSTMGDRPGTYAPGWGHLEAEAGKPVHLWRSGQVIWCGFDHGSIAGRKFGSMGMIDYFRLPKRMWYWYRNAYRKIPSPEWPAPGTPAGLQLAADKTKLTDIDDALVIVTVVDEAGQHISDCPPVTLTIESGPGEFPTGPSITFEPNSDIAIRDGQAAIEMRAYYAGTTVIRATSPGLKDATLTIVSEGPTGGQLAKPRPYVRFDAKQDTSVHIFGRQNPTRASSEAHGHNAGFANDGNPATFWQAADLRPNAWWQVDLEKIVTVTEVKLKFPQPGNYRCRAEISEDAQQWTALNGEGTGRFVRITFTELPPGRPAGIADVEILGRLINQ
jgi:beta-galactosidase